MPKESKVMHEGCSSSFGNGKQVVDKLRQMGFSGMAMPLVVPVQCWSCEETTMMETLESCCAHCGMVYGVTPCHANDPSAIQAAGINY